MCQKGSSRAYAQTTPGECTGDRSREGKASWLRRHPKAGSDALRWLQRSCAWGRDVLGPPKAFLLYVQNTWFPKVMRVLCDTMKETGIKNGLMLIMNQ